MELTFNQHRLLHILAKRNNFIGSVKTFSDKIFLDDPMSVVWWDSHLYTININVCFVCGAEIHDVVSAIKIYEHGLKHIEESNLMVFI